MIEMAPARIQVEVIYALPDRYWSVRLDLAEGSRVAEALAAAKAQLPEVPIDQDRLAVFSRPVTLDGVLRDGDRLEILRPLIADPKQARRERAADARKRGPG
jgi:putative ubiquitin-RnfH superfamily antitoxin RatB of RatAB toxin-antitoxin module